MPVGHPLSLVPGLAFTQSCPASQTSLQPIFCVTNLGKPVIGSLRSTWLPCSRHLMPCSRWQTPMMSRKSHFPAVGVSSANLPNPG